MKVSNKTRITDLKTAYMKIIDKTGTPVDKIRFFCLGKEFKDDLYLYSYDVADGMVIQCMIKQ